MNILRIIAALSAAMAGGAKAAEPGTFERLAVYRGLGGMEAAAVGPGPSNGSQRYYVAFMYTDITFDIVGIDPRDGRTKVYTNPVPGEYGVRAMVAGPDGNVYAGTLPTAHLLKLNPKHDDIEDLGRPSQTEQYIWDLCVGSDDRIYGATYPEAKLVRYNPRTGKTEDLGRMDSAEQYARYVAPGADGFIYVGIGSGNANIAAYEIATGKHAEIIPQKYQTVTIARVYRGEDGNVYGQIASHYFRLSGWNATPINREDVSPPEARNKLRDGRRIDIKGHSITVTEDSGEASRFAFKYDGNNMGIFRLGPGPDGSLYGSSALPLHLIRFDPRSGTLSELGDIGEGEAYSLLSSPPDLLIAAYSTPAPLFKFDPAHGFSDTTDDENPKPIPFTGSDSGWRPEAMIHGPGGIVYIGSIAGYGKLTGPLVSWNPQDDRVSVYPNVAPDQGIASLTSWRNMIVGGSATFGGGGSHPTQKDPVLFVWDPKEARKILEIVPVPGAAMITDLVAAPNELIWGVAQSSIFSVDLNHGNRVTTQPLPGTRPVYNSAALGPDGRIWGLTQDSIFVIDSDIGKVQVAAKPPCPVTTGFAFRDNAIYFACKSELWRYRLP